LDHDFQYGRARVIASGMQLGIGSQSWASH
jgi:hypothetical protein